MDKYNNPNSKRKLKRKAKRKAQELCHVPIFDSLTDTVKDYNPSPDEFLAIENKEKGTRHEPSEIEASERLSKEARAYNNKLYKPASKPASGKGQRLRCGKPPSDKIKCAFSKARSI